MAAVKHTELPAVTVPPHLWMRSGRPVEGRAVQIAVPAVLILAALLASESGLLLRAGLVIAGAALYLALPAMALGRLERLGREIQAAEPGAARQLLKALPNKTVVRYFAPNAWRTLQAGVLQLKIGDGKAAAESFAETARLIHQPEAVMLISARAHALVLAGERIEAHSLLQDLAKENLLGSRDQLDLGIVLLIESQKKNKQALAYVEAARKTIGDHPRVLAALALALQKTERIDEASELLEQVQISLQGGEPDPIVDDLVKRARKGLQVFIEAQLRKERRSRSRRTTIVVSSDLAASEIVSGEIGAGDQAELDNPTTSFRAVDAGSPSVISSKSVDGELSSEERSMLNLPNSPIRRAEDARANAFAIEEDEPGEVGEVEEVKPPEPEAAIEASVKPATSESADREPQVSPDATNLKPPASLMPVESSGPLGSSLLDSLFSEPMAAAKPESISLLNPAVAVPSAPTASDLSKILPPMPLPPEPAVSRTAPPVKPAEVDVPVFRRKPAGPPVDRANRLGNLPTGGNSGGSAPPLTSLPVAGGAKTPSLPTRTSPSFGVPGSSAPKSTTPMFRAPVPGKPDGDDS